MAFFIFTQSNFMNPSARGWINKLISKEVSLKENSNDITSYYLNLREAGFVYGNNIFVANTSLRNSDFTVEERCKMNLILALKNIYLNHQIEESFVKSAISFYTKINAHKTSLFSELLGGKKTVFALEKIIHKRIQFDTNVLTKRFQYFITNALLYVDILSYYHFVNSPETTLEYIKNLEATIESTVYHVLNAKNTKTEYDNGLIKLLESSLRFQNHETLKYEDIMQKTHNKFESQYVLDIACMATWSDQIIDESEEQLLNNIGKDLNLSNEAILSSIESVNTFYTTHKKDIALLSSKNVVKSFYDNSSKMVTKLISRNSKRLIKELKESKELLVLISQSTVRELSKDEQKRINEQLMDIFKSIPSFAIFMLPGGALLLPLFVKFIPKLLPSAFDENRIEEKNKDKK